MVDGFELDYENVKEASWQVDLGAISMARCIFTGWDHDESFGFSSLQDAMKVAGETFDKRCYATREQFIGVVIAAEESVEAYRRTDEAVADQFERLALRLPVGGAT